MKKARTKLEWDIEKMKMEKCFCGGGCCVCELDGLWTAHCQDCERLYAGDTQKEVEDKWNNEMSEIRLQPQGV